MNKSPKAKGETNEYAGSFSEAAEAKSKTGKNELREREATFGVANDPHDEKDKRRSKKSGGQIMLWARGLQNSEGHRKRGQGCNYLSFFAAAQ